MSSRLCPLLRIGSLFALLCRVGAYDAPVLLQDTATRIPESVGPEPRHQFNKGYDDKTLAPHRRVEAHLFAPPAHPPRKQGKLRPSGRYY